MIKERNTVKIITYTSMVNNSKIKSCFVFENTGKHRIIAHTPDLPPMVSADDTISIRSFATFFRMLGTERVFCVESKFGPTLILCPAERKTVSIAVILSPESSSKTEISASLPIDSAVPYRFRRSVIESAKEIYELLFDTADILSFSEGDPLGEITLAKKISFFFSLLSIPCEVHVGAKEELPVFKRGSSEVFFFLAAICIKLSHIGAKNTLYIKPTPTSNGYLLDIVIPSLSKSENDVLREYVSALLGSCSEFPFAFGCDSNVTKIRYYPLQPDESFFGLKRPGAKD